MTKMRSLTVNHPVKSSAMHYIALLLSTKPWILSKKQLNLISKFYFVFYNNMNLLSQKFAFQIQSIFLIMEKLEMFLVVNWVQQGYDNGTECLKINKNGQNST